MTTGEVPREAAEILRTARTIAVLGMKGAEDGGTPAHGVPAYLRKHGYTIIPVNPELADAGEPGAVASLGDLDAPPDVVQVFRRPDAIDSHADELLALRPKAVWFQLGIRNDAVAGRLREAGITVVQDRCMYHDHAEMEKAGAL